jgi:phosphoribosylaminoimidazolecarboxamide formyltransferase/IMP cyclohydrolase
MCLGEQFTLDRWMVKTTRCSARVWIRTSGEKVAIRVTEQPNMARAIISVSNKRGVVELARAFVAHGVEVCSTGGTATTLREANVPVTTVESVTGAAEMLDGRVKTLHPAIHAGLLARRDDPAHMEALRQQGITPIDYLVVNLYPFKETAARPDATFAEIVEQIDIGGPTLLRAAAKNMEHVVVLTDPDEYPLVQATLAEGRELTSAERQRLAAKVFRTTAAYDALIAEYLTRQTEERFPETLTLTWERQQLLRYGENPHLAAAFYREPFAPASSIASARQLHGKELSYLNILDADAALEMASEFARPAVAVIKHANPCGVGAADSIEMALEKAIRADPVSIFGGIVAFNRPVTAACAERIGEMFLEVILAPAFSDSALAALQRKKNLRLLEVPVAPLNLSLNDLEAKSAWPPLGYRVRSVRGGVLAQDAEWLLAREIERRVVTQRAPTDDEWMQVLFAWAVVKHVRSNAIVLARDEQTVGVGAGQMNRVLAARIAIEQAGELAHGAVLASDAFFPMSDTVEAAASAGITAIIQPGGSIRDSDSIAAADAAGIAMVFTGTRQFSH